MNQIAISQPTTATQTDKAVAISLTLSADLKVEEQLTSDFDFKGYIITNDVSDQKLAEAHRVLKGTMDPANDSTIARALAQLMALTAGKAKDIDLTLESYVQKLRQYPKDAVIESLNKLSDEYKWFPSWSEIKDDVEFRCRHRIELLRAIERKQNERTITRLRQSVQCSA